jgi:hypothetical protein
MHGSSPEIIHFERAPARTFENALRLFADAGPRDVRGRISESRPRSTRSEAQAGL